MRWLISLLEWLNVFLVLGTFFCYLAPYISPVTFWPASFIGLSYPWLLLGHIIFILLWGVMRSKFVILSILSLAFGWKHIQSLVGFNQTETVAEAKFIKIMSFNTHSFRHNDNKRKRIDQEKLSETLNLEGIDIAFLQEYPTVGKDHAYTNFFRKENRMKYSSPLPNVGITVFSRYPIIHSETEYFSNGANGYQYVDIKIDSTILRCYNIHLQSNAVSGIANEVVTEGNIQEKETWLNIKGMMRQYKRAAVKRASQAEEIAKAVRESPYPVILCGDFNEIPQSYVYQTLSTGLQDAFIERGRGLGITYNGKIPALRIDYILTSQELEIIDFEVGKQNFSDHFPVFSSIRLE